MLAGSHLIIWPQTDCETKTDTLWSGVNCWSNLATVIHVTIASRLDYCNLLYTRHFRNFRLFRMRLPGSWLIHHSLYSSFCGNCTDFQLVFSHKVLVLTLKALNGGTSYIKTPPSDFIMTPPSTFIQPHMGFWWCLAFNLPVWVQQEPFPLLSQTGGMLWLRRLTPCWSCLHSTRYVR